MQRSSARIVQKRKDESEKSERQEAGKASRAKEGRAAQPRRQGTSRISEKSAPTKAPTAARKKQKVASSKATAVASSNPTKGPWAKVKGRRGQLKMVVEMPFDILLELFSYLDPVDLLNLSKASHAMRALLLDRSVALPLWKYAFERVQPQPPACPEDMNLPQYASFLYGRTCSACDSTVSLKRMWPYYLRLCKGCITKEFIPVPTREEEPLVEKIGSILVPHYDRETWSAWRRHGYPRVIYEKYLDELRKMVKDKTTSRLDRYVKEEKEKWERIRIAAGGWRGWEYRVGRAKVEDLINRRTNRKEAIKERLREIGYGAILDRLSNDALMTLPGMGGVKPLSDAEWNRLEQLLIDTLDELQKTFDQRDRKALLIHRTRNVAWLHEYYIALNREKQQFAPPKRELAHIEPFRTMIYDTPSDVKVDHPDFTKLLDKLPQIYDEWKKQADEVLLRLLPTEGQAESSGSKETGKGKVILPAASTLNLATTLFSCEWCPEILTYPIVLSHGCLSQKHRAKKGSKKDRDDDQDAEDDDVDPNVSWNEGGDQVAFDEYASKIAAAVIKALGEDPSTVPWEELDRLNQRVECLRCRKEKGANKRLVMGWRAAILHEIDKHSEDDDEDSYETGWEGLDADSLALAHEKEKQAKNNSHIRPSGNVHCVECKKLTMEEDGRLSYGNYGFKLPEPGATECPKGHDLTKEGATYSDGWMMAFKAMPHPVKIA